METRKRGAFGQFMTRFGNVSPRARFATVGGALVVVALVVFAVVNRSSDSTSLLPKGDAEDLLVPADPNGSPHFVLTDAFDPASNTAGDVPEDLAADQDNLLEVSAATMVEGAGPYDVVWKVKKGDATIDCVNCAMLDARVKSVVADVLGSGAGDGVTSVVGVDTSRTLAGDYSGNGWQAEFVVGDDAKGLQSGEKIFNWLLKNSADKKVFSITWQNLLYSRGECGVDLASADPVQAYNSSVGDSAAARRDAAMDRVVFASPAYKPVFEDRDGAQFLTGWKGTSC